MRADLRDAICNECDARCIPGQTHLQHNAGWIKKMLVWDWRDLCLDGYPGWDLVESNGIRHPPFIRLAIRNKIDKSSEDIAREFDGLAKGRFYSRDWSRDGSPSVGEGETYDAGWWFQITQDAYDFINRYGGQAE